MVPVIGGAYMLFNYISHVFFVAGKSSMLYAESSCRTQGSRGLQGSKAALGLEW